MKRHVSLEQFIQILVLGTVIVVPFVFIPILGFNDFFYYPKFITLVIITCCLLIVSLLNISKLKSLFRFDLINKLLFVYFIIITISLFFSLDPLLSLQGNVLRYDGYVTQIMYILLFLFARNIRTLDNRFIYLVSISSGILAFYGVLQYLGLDPFVRDMTRLNWTSTFSTFGNQNFFGSYLVLQIPFSLYTIMYLHKKWAYLTYGISLLALLMTMTRGSWVGYFISMVFLLVTLYKQDKQRFLHDTNLKVSIIYSFVIVIVFNIFSNNMLSMRFLTMITDSKTFISTSYAKHPEIIDQLGSVRMFIWIRVMELIKMRPLTGFGIENLQIAFSQYFREDVIRVSGNYVIIDKAHNDYLHIAVSSGIPSLIAYLSYLFTIAYSSLKRFNNKIYILLFTSILGYMTCLFFNISVVSVTYIVWIYLGLISSYEEINVLNTNK